MPQMRFRIPGVDWTAAVPAETPTYIANTRGYIVASAGGAVVPYGAEHLVGKMGGLWFHPLRLCAGWLVTVDGFRCDAATDCVVEHARITRSHDTPAGRVTVVEQMDPSAAAIHLWITVTAPQLRTVQIGLQILGGIEGCWFGGIAPGQPETSVSADGTLVRGSDSPEIRGGMAIATTPALTWLSTETDIVGHCNVASGTTLHIVIAAGHDALPGTVAQQLLHVAPAVPDLPTGPRLSSGDADLDAAWCIAQHNIGQLVAEYPGMPRYALAGIPEYPQFFGCDTTYSIPGMVSAGYGAVARSALAGLAARAQAACGRVPHEITTNGRVYHPGNTQETPQFAVACWQYLCWTGDMDAARAWYPVCVEGMEHVAGVLAGRHWPYGDGMVERHGMGPFKLDSVCYIVQALAALTAWARALGLANEAARWEHAAAGIRARFEAAWWLPEENCYADSLQSNGTPQLDHHWTAIVPVQTGTATPARQRTVYQHVKNTLTNTWGLMHTGGTEASVWTLPTGLLALAAFDQDDGAYGVQLLKNIAVTARHGSLGLLKELIPQGLCFVQLWSAGLLCQGITEGVLGIAPDLLHQRIAITPRLPDPTRTVTLSDLTLGAHRVDVSVSAGQLTIAHRSGPSTLEWQVGGSAHLTHPGTALTISL